MAAKSGASSRSDRAKIERRPDSEQDPGFELLEAAPQQPAVKDPDVAYWVAPPNVPDPIGPLTADAVRRNLASGVLSPESLVWHQELSEWTRISALFGPARPVASAAAAPPPLHAANHHAPTRTAGNFDSPWFWNPSAAVYRAIARAVAVLGMLTLIFSLLLAPFGWSRFEAGLQILLIAAVLELAAVVRGLPSPGGGEPQRSRGTADERLD